LMTPDRRAARIRALGESTPVDAFVAGKPGRRTPSGLDCRDSLYGDVGPSIRVLGGGRSFVYGRDRVYMSLAAGTPAADLECISLGTLILRRSLRFVRRSNEMLVMWWVWRFRGPYEPEFGELSRDRPGSRQNRDKIGPRPGISRSRMCPTLGLEGGAGRQPRGRIRSTFTAVSVPPQAARMDAGLTAPSSPVR